MREEEDARVRAVAAEERTKEDGRRGRLRLPAEPSAPPAAASRPALPWGSCGVCQIARPAPMCAARPSLVFIARCPSRAGATICLRGRASSRLGSEGGDCLCVSPEAGRGSGCESRPRSSRVTQPDSAKAADELFLSKRVLQRALVHAFSLRQELTLVARSCGAQGDRGPFQLLPEEQLRRHPGGAFRREARRTTRSAEGCFRSAPKCRDRHHRRGPPGDRASCGQCRGSRNLREGDACWCRLARKPVGASEWRRYAEEEREEEGAFSTGERARGVAVRLCHETSK
ncbi:hypothetical protein TGARI_372180 [Toxoplasma gondii ARI]|uniref:Uncharacterized protein n=1 Tax=Toxoplasma gondii ARI TaxID=1074872 RepID=A0A139XIH9_TOXGO|nr:hypothetical protein TGARI_372180 [Toxoplasma gondii ARI]